jgi:glycosyltransferase involved in cell wall biosynthesis
MAAPIRLAFLQASLGFGGAERLTQALALGLRGRFEPIAIHLYAPGPIGEQLAAAGVPQVSGLARGRWDTGVGGALARVYAQHRVDVVYTTDSAMPLFWAGWRRRRSPRPRLVVGFHSTGKPGDVLQHRLANAAALPIADRLVALAGPHRDYLSRALHLDPARMDVIPNGVDTRRFAPAADRAALRAELGLPEAPLAGMVAAVRPEKNHSLFLRAAAQVVSRIPPARFAVIGDGPERARLEQEAADLGIGHAVLFLGARDDVPALVRALDVCVLSSKPVVETFPVTLLEAMASGVPVVSTDVGSIAEMVPEGEVGFRVPHGDAGALADRIARLLGDPALAHTLGCAGRARVERLYTVETMTDAYARLFEACAGGGA